MPPPDKDLLMIIVGGDALALSTARELCQLRGRRIVVLSRAWHSAATYAAVALDQSCFRGLKFPEPDRPLTGFAVRLAEGDRIAGRSVAEAEHALGARIIAIDRATAIAGDQLITSGARMVVYGMLDRLLASAPRQPRPEDRPSVAHSLRPFARRSHWRLRRLDPYLIGFVAAVLVLFGVGTWYFRNSFESDWLTAAYFVLSTMTTTGFGDIAPDHTRPLDLWATMVLMLLGTVFTGLFIVFAAARLTRGQWVRMQGLRPIYRRGHIVVCGSGSIGTGVIDLLLDFDKPLVVVEQSPGAALDERARARGCRP